MSVSITERIREFVLQRGPVSVSQVAAAIPALATEGGEDRARLLVRLDPQLERTPRDQWVARGVVLSEERTIQQAAEDYFRTLGRPGAPLSSVVATIAERTSIDAGRVKRMLTSLYEVHETNVFNRLRRREEN